MKQLKVILLEHEVGILEQHQDGRISFTYSAEWLNAEHACPLSISLPLQQDAFDERQCAPFFGGLLPEENNREIVASNFGITARNDFAMLREIGGECAGAVSLISLEKSPASTSNDYEVITETDLIGNYDAHGKNFSLLYESTVNGRATRLAPFYDLVSTAIYPQLSTKMAMKLGKSYRPETLRARDWEVYWDAIGFSKNQARKQSLQFAKRCLACFQAPQNTTQAKVQEIVTDRSSKLQALLA
jgi:HipA-like protein